MGRSQERRDARVEQLIQRHRPRPEQEQSPASPIQLEFLNDNGLIEDAIERQRETNRQWELREGKPVILTRLVAWETLAAAQRRGLRIEPRRPKVDVNAA